jgi:tRNA (guanine37-N1)-methyltransferase
MARVVLICGRYEGVDERVRETLADEELSVGDVVVSGGEVPALMVVDAVSRFVPGVLGRDGAAEDDSFAEGLLESPYYTRPADFRGQRVPEVLTSGDHGAIARWRAESAQRVTREKRPDLLARDGTRDAKEREGGER